ncbi:MAG: hypothetical protein ACRDU4_13865 [Mycobacterium sp.]
MGDGFRLGQGTRVHPTRAGRGERPPFTIEAFGLGLNDFPRHRGCFLPSCAAYCPAQIRIALANIVGILNGLSLPVPALPGKCCAFLTMPMMALNE